MVEKNTRVAGVDPSIENTKVFYKLKTYYAITINPDDKHQYFHDGGQRFSNFINHANDYYFCRLKQNEIDYVLHPEISEPRDNIQYAGSPRLHFHGVVYLKSKQSILHFLLQFLVKVSSFAMYKIEPLKDSYKWESYCKKQSFLGFKPLSNYDKADDLWSLIHNRDTPEEEVAEEGVSDARHGLRCQSEAMGGVLEGGPIAPYVQDEYPKVPDLLDEGIKIEF